MNQLIKIENQPHWVVAKFNHPPFNTLSKEAQKKGALDIITKAHFDDGNKGGTDASVLTFQSQALIAELTGNLGTLTLAEIESAFKMGIRGEFGEYFGLCAKTYHKFLKGYMTHPEKIRANTEYLEYVSRVFKTTDKPLVDKMKESKASCLSAFAEYKKTGNLPFAPWGYYNILRDELKVIEWTKEEKAEIRKEAEKQYTQKLKEDKANRLINKIDYENIIANLDESNRSFINVCKRVALKKYFDKITKLEI